MNSEQINVPFFKPSINTAEENAVLEVMRSGWLTTGKYALEFEKRFSEFVSGNSHDETTIRDDTTGASGASCETAIKSFAVNSNTSGLILAYEACGVKKDKAIVTTPYTFVSTATSAVHLGADVIFCDTEKDSYNIDCDSLERILEKDAHNEKKIAAIVPVHIAGNVCDMKRIMTLAHKYGVRVVEDAAHSFPSRTPLGFAGTIGDVGVFSFYVTKTITTGEGGMICCRDEKIARRIATMRMHGMDRTTWDRYTSPRASWEYDIIEAGYKFNLPDVLAAIGIEQLKKADEFFQKRLRFVKKYNQAFADLDFVQIPPDGEGNAWHLYLLRIVSEKLKITRNEFAMQLQKMGVGISVHFIPLFHFSYWKNRYKDFRASIFPNAEKQFQATISIPLFPDMTDEMANYVIDCVKKIGTENHA